jgi:DNA-directed RNA polymerase specialized sigma24 family protein
MRFLGTQDDPEPDWVLTALQKHEPALLRYAASLVGETRAQDVVQDAFLRLCSQPVERVRDHLAAWLFTVCRNRALEIRRADRRLSRLEEKDEMLESPDSSPGA